MLSIPTEEEFYSAASRFISGVMDEIGLQEHNIVLDQSPPAAQSFPRG